MLKNVLSYADHFCLTSVTQNVFVLNSTYFLFISTEGVEYPETEEELLMTPSLKLNVVGEPRSNPVPLPTSILGGRPNAKTNYRVGD